MKKFMLCLIAISFSAVTTASFASGHVDTYTSKKPGKPTPIASIHGGMDKPGKPGKPVHYGPGKPEKPGKPGHHGPKKPPTPPVTKVPEIDGAGTAIAFALIGGFVLIARERRRIGNV